MKILHYFAAFFVLAGVVHIGDILVTIITTILRMPNNLKNSLYKLCMC